MLINAGKNQGQIKIDIGDVLNISTNQGRFFGVVVSGVMTQKVKLSDLFKDSDNQEIQNGDYLLIKVKG